MDITNAVGEYYRRAEQESSRLLKIARMIERRCEELLRKIEQLDKQEEEMARLCECGGKLFTQCFDGDHFECECIDKCRKCGKTIL
jgi:hypothetical protein